MKEIFYDWGGWNVWLFHLINDIHTSWLDQFMLFGTRLGDHTNFLLYLCCMMLVVLVTVVRQNSTESPESEAATRLGLTTISVFVFSYWLDGEIIEWIKTTLDFPRPPLALQSSGFFSLHGPTLHIVGTPEYHHSFPSGHSAFAMLVAASFWPLLGHLRFLAVLFVIWVGVSRISLGMHFPADVLGGYLLSFGVVLGIRFLITQAMAWKTVRLSYGQPE